MTKKMQIPLTVNGETHDILAEPRELLIYVLRERLNITGPHVGCETSHCGACTVTLNGKSVKSCTVFAAQADGAEITTIEGLGSPDNLHALQEAFKEHHGLQCGFCTPGMITRAAKLLEENPNPTEEDVRFGMAGNLCRCTGYQNIVKSVLAAASDINTAKEAALNDLTSDRDDRVAKLKGLGCSRKRVEDARFTQGKGNYVDDIKMPGMLHGDFVRSPYAHARVVSIDASAALALALALDGVVAVLADGKVLFQGQEVAYVVARDRYVAADAVELVEVEYEELPVIVDPFESLKSDVILREDIAGETSGAHGERRHPNHIFLWEEGDKAATEQVIESADVVAEEMIYITTAPTPARLKPAAVSPRWIR